MNSHGLKTSAPSEADPRLAELVDELTARLKAGETPDFDLIQQQHPEHAAELQGLLPAMRLLADLSNSASRNPGTVVPASGLGEAVAGLLGDFRIVREIGRGGMAVVYEAEQMSLERRVALKVLPLASTMDARRLQRFHIEAKAAACLHHTNIVPVFAVGCERGVHFYAMQLIDGMTLAAVIHDRQTPSKETTREPREGPVTTPYTPGIASTAPGAALSTAKPGGDAAYFRKVAELGAQTAEALDYAHQMGVVHRDIKPGNLMVDGHGTIWVTDFGLALLQTDTGMTMTGDLLGTLRYMSPEQALAQRVPIDHRTDVYSLGATLYELLTLRPAITGEDRQELLRQIAFEEPLSPRRLNRAIPAELETIVLKALEKNPAERYATAQELADDLCRFLEDQPIKARRPSWRQVAGRWARRRQAVVWSAAVVAAMAAMLLAASIGWLASERAARLSETRRVANEALEESASWQQKRRLPEALSTARRAAGLVASGTPDDALRQRVQARVADLELLDELENARLESTAVRDGHFDDILRDRRYGEIFRAAGLDLEALPADAAGAHLRRSTVAVEIAAALDDWAMVRRQRRAPSEMSWKHLLAVARAADPDAQRTRLRDALESTDREALIAQAAPNNVSHLEAQTLASLGQMLWKKGAFKEAEALLREAQHQHPDDFWINHMLFEVFSLTQPPQPEGELRFSTVAVALRPRSTGALMNLANALWKNRDVDGAIKKYLAAIELDPKFASPHNSLGALLLAEKKDVDGAMKEYRAAIELDPKSADAHNGLGNALWVKTDVDGAMKEYRAAIELDPKSARPHNNLGIVLRGKKDVDGAMKEYRAAIELDPKSAEPHNNLGIVLHDKKDVDGAIKEFRAAVELDPQYADPHKNLGNALVELGRPEAGQEEYRKAIVLGPKVAEFRMSLAFALKERGQLKEAAAELREAVELGEKEAAAEQELCERLLTLCQRLPGLQAGQDGPANQVERLEFAQLCQPPFDPRPALAARLYADAFTAEPKLSDVFPHRYNAACAAALAGCGKGKDAPSEKKDLINLRRQALDWLRADREALRGVLEKDPDQAGPSVVEALKHWLEDPDFEGVRVPEALSKLPEAERGEWQQLWADVAATLKKAREKITPEEKPQKSP